MTVQRYDELMKSEMEDDEVLSLTPDEIAKGWHFCWDWDGLLVGPGMKEQESCVCLKPEPFEPDEK